MKETVEWLEFQRRAYDLTNLEMFIGRNLVGEYFKSVNVQLELPYPDQYDRLVENYDRTNKHL